jgi:cytidine deaminase
VKKKIFLWIGLPLGAAMFLFIAVKEMHTLSPLIALTERQTTLLISLSDSALMHGDVPVAAVLLYNDSVIGTGYNTVLANGNAGGHAEINAISSAITLLGKETFDTLDKKSLTLISTFEPCPMCRGAIIEYNIRSVVYLKPKSLWYWFFKDGAMLRYEIAKRGGEPKWLQDSLFVKHPKYAGQNKRY